MKLWLTMVAWNDRKCKPACPDYWRLVLACKITRPSRRRWWERVESYQGGECPIDSCSITRHKPRCRRYSNEVYWSLMALTRKWCPSDINTLTLQFTHRSRLKEYSAAIVVNGCRGSFKISRRDRLLDSSAVFLNKQSNVNDIVAYVLIFTSASCALCSVDTTSAAEKQVYFPSKLQTTFSNLRKTFCWNCGWTALTRFAEITVSSNQHVNQSVPVASRRAMDKIVCGFRTGLVRRNINVKRANCPIKAAVRLIPASMILRKARWNMEAAAGAGVQRREPLQLSHPGSLAWKTRISKAVVTQLSSCHALRTSPVTWHDLMTSDVDMALHHAIRLNTTASDRLIIINKYVIFIYCKGRCIAFGKWCRGVLIMQQINSCQRSVIQTEQACLGFFGMYRSVCLEDDIMWLHLDPLARAKYTCPNLSKPIHRSPEFDVFLFILCVQRSEKNETKRTIQCE